MIDSYINYIILILYYALEIIYTMSIIDTILIILYIVTKRNKIVYERSIMQ